MGLNLDTAQGAMRLISNIGRRGFIDGIGISKAEFDRFIGDEQWMATDRNRMTVVLHTLLNASVDAMNLPRFDLPAEYIAAGIAMFVSGINTLPACIFGPQAPSAEMMGRGPAGSVQPCTAQQVFALVVQLFDSPGRNAARAQFEKATGLALDLVAPPDKKK
ncbi:MAG: external scaffolding protein [Microviridae sp.]|nr:MAG: external scaffolding protein [Microviridae sp.]